jgi:hypothetical protein
MIDEKDNEFNGVVKILKELQQVKTPNNFEADLMRRVNAGEFREEKTENWLSRIFIPKTFIPSAALAVIAVLILFVIKPGSTEIENPFNARPRVRKDMITTTSQLSEEKKVDKELQKMTKKDKIRSDFKQKSEIAESDSQNKNDYMNKKSPDNRHSTDYTSPNYEVVSQDISNFYGVDKNGLNFRQVNLTKSERLELNRLKENLMQFMKENNSK